MASRRARQRRNEAASRAFASQESRYTCVFRCCLNVEGCGWYPWVKGTPAFTLPREEEIGENVDNIMWQVQFGALPANGDNTAT